MIRQLSSLLAAACFALPVGAWSQSSPMAGKTMCLIGGKTYYQNGPCPGAAISAKNTSADDYIAQQDEAEAQRNPFCRTYTIKAIYLGMRERELRCFYRYRDPTHINVTTTARGERKQYVYRDWGEYLYFDDGVLTSMQGQQR